MIPHPQPLPIRERRYFMFALQTPLPNGEGPGVGLLNVQFYIGQKVLVRFSNTFAKLGTMPPAHIM